MTHFINGKAKIFASLFVAFFISATLIHYVFPTKTAEINVAFFDDMKKDANNFIAGIFDASTRKNNERMASLIQEAKTGTYKTVARGVDALETVNGAVVRVNVSAMEWQPEKTFVVNGKTIKLTIAKGESDPSQELLEKLAKYYQ